jgi:hypothetical protein
MHGSSWSSQRGGSGFENNRVHSSRDTNGSMKASSSGEWMAASASAVDAWETVDSFLGDVAVLGEGEASDGLRAGDGRKGLVFWDGWVGDLIVWESGSGS